MKKLQYVFVASLTLILSGSASAQRGGMPQGQGQRPENPVVTAIDKNGDGEISAAEIENAANALKTLDRNGDGQVTFDEVRAQIQPAGANAGARPAPEAGGRPAGGGGPGGRSTGNETLGSLKIGSKIPDVKFFDADGKEMSTRDLRGKHAVLVFGCLT